MTNVEIASTFERIANLLEIKGELIYKVIAYRRAAESIRLLTTEISSMSKEEILNIPGVGQAITEKINEILTTGHLEFLQKLEREVPPSLIDLLQIQDVGPKKVALFWKQANVTTLAELEQAALAGQLRVLPGMGEKSESRILAGIQALKQRKPRLPIHEALSIAETWLGKIRKIQYLEKVEIAGSLRRWKTTIGDLDFVGATHHPDQVMQNFSSLDCIKRILSQGENKTSVECEEGLNIQLWLQPPERFGSLWQFVTGSKEHNVRLREYAQKQNLSLSERGFVDQNLKETLCPQEQDIYQTLGLQYIPPELREDRGEIQSAMNHDIPQLISIKDIQSDLHVHTDWSDAKSTLEEMAQEAIKRGLKILAIADHGCGSPDIDKGMDEKRLQEQRLAIEQLQKHIGNPLLILQSVEVEILLDGALALSDDVLAKLDLVIASMHKHHNQPRHINTERLIKAINHPLVDIIAHPSGREMPRTEGADLEWEPIFQAARDHQVALEINSNPFHLDLDEIRARQASQSGCLLTINTDSHSILRLENIKFGIGIARRAWVSPQNVINTWSKAKLLDWLKNRKK